MLHQCGDFFGFGDRVVMLPDDTDNPSAFGERLDHLVVAFTVASQLL